MRLKKELFIVIVLISCAFSRVYAQKTITIDFDKKMIEEYENFKKGEFFNIVINDINLNLYKVEIEYNDTVLSKPLNIPTFTTFGIDEIAKVIESISSLETSTSSTFSHENLNWENFVQIYNNLEIVKKESKPTYLDSIFNILFHRERIIILNEVENFSKARAEADLLIIKVYKNMLNYNKVATNKADFIKLDDILKIRQTFLKQKISALKKHQEFQDQLLTVSDSIKSQEKMKKNIDIINNSYKELYTVLDSAINNFEIDKLYKFLLQLVYLENNKDNKYTSLPIQVNNEKLELKYRIVPRDSNSLLQSYSSRITVKSKNTTYFSVGLSFYGASLFDKAYSITSNTDSITTYGIVAEDDLGAEFGMTSLVRIGHKFDTKKDFGAHLSFGPGIAINNTIKPRLLVGAGVSYGDKHNFSVDVGFITGYVDKLSNAFDTETIYAAKPESVVVSDLKGGVFAAVGYYFKF